MNITLLAPCKDLSGGIKVIATYGNKLLERGHQVTVIYPRKPLNSLRALKREAIRRLRREKDHLDRFNGRLLAVDRMDEAHIPDGDIVIATAWETAEWANELSPAKGRKFYLIQGHEVWNAPRERVHATLRMPFHKITISSWLKDLVDEIADDDSTVLVHNGRDIILDEDQVMQTERPYDVGMVYSPIPNKGSDLGLSALWDLYRSNPELRFILFGTEAPNKALPPTAEFHLKPAPEKIRRLYLETRIWLSTSYEEGFCLPCLEAISSGAVLVSTDNKGVRDIITAGSSGYITEPGNAKELAARAHMLLNDPEQQQRMRRAALEQSAGFDWDRSTDMLEQLFSETAVRKAA